MKLATVVLMLSLTKLMSVAVEPNEIRLPRAKKPTACYTSDTTIIKFDANEINNILADTEDRVLTQISDLKSTCGASVKYEDIGTRVYRYVP